MCPRKSRTRKACVKAQASTPTRRRQHHTGRYFSAIFLRVEAWHTLTTRIYSFMHHCLFYTNPCFLTWQCNNETCLDKPGSIIRHIMSILPSTTSMTSLSPTQEACD